MEFISFCPRYADGNPNAPKNVKIVGTFSVSRSPSCYKKTCYRKGKKIFLVGNRSDSEAKEVTKEEVERLYRETPYETVAMVTIPKSGDRNKDIDNIAKSAGYAINQHQNGASMAKYKVKIDENTI